MTFSGFFFATATFTCSRIAVPGARWRAAKLLTRTVVIFLANVPSFGMSLQMAGAHKRKKKYPEILKRFRAHTHTHTDRSMQCAMGKWMAVRAGDGKSCQEMAKEIGKSYNLSSWFRFLSRRLFFIERSFACRYGCREQLASSSMLVLACVCVSFASLSAILLLLVGRRSFRYHFGLIHPGDTAAAAMLLELLFLSTVSRRKGSYFFGVPSLWSALMDGTSSDLSQPAPSSFSGSAR